MISLQLRLCFKCLSQSCKTFSSSSLFGPRSKGIWDGNIWDEITHKRIFNEAINSLFRFIIHWNFIQLWKLARAKVFIITKQLLVIMSLWRRLDTIKYLLLEVWICFRPWNWRMSLIKARLLLSPEAMILVKIHIPELYVSRRFYFNLFCLGNNISNSFDFLVPKKHGLLLLENSPVHWLVTKSWIHSSNSWLGDVGIVWQLRVVDRRRGKSDSTGCVSVYTALEINLLTLVLQ